VNFSSSEFAADATFDRVIFLQFADFKDARLGASFILSPPQG
jgi:hypothetical protein